VTTGSASAHLGRLELLGGAAKYHETDALEALLGDLLLVAVGGRVESDGGEVVVEAVVMAVVVGGRENESEMTLVHVVPCTRAVSARVLGARAARVHFNSKRSAKLAVQILEASGGCVDFFLAAIEQDGGAALLLR